MDMPEQTGVYLMPPIWVTDRQSTPMVSGSLHSGSYSLENAAELIAQGPIGEGVIAHVHRDGLVMFEFPSDHAEFTGDGVDAFPALSARTALVNAFQAVFHSGTNQLLEKVPVTHRSLVHGDTGKDEVICYRANEELVRYLYKVPNRKVIGTALGTWMHVKDAWVVGRNQRRPQDFQLAIERLAAVYAAGGVGALRRYEVLLNACAALESRDPDTTVVLAFALCENAANRMWSGTAERIRSTDRLIPKNLGKLNITTVTELLRVTGEMPEPVAAELDEYRIARNRWAHQMEGVPRETAVGCLGLASRMLATADGTSYVVDIRSVSGVAL
ncbi:MAG: hypothetical protein WBA45_08265 [Microthrixaceae bacterium]